MVEKIGHIKNPLTIIAIFAAIAEISGTGVLPFIDSSCQRIYIWFLILFPVFLVVLFFVTLNLNHKVLYAPSDYKDESNFLKLFNNPTSEEQQIKLKQEIDEAKKEVIEEKPRKSATTHKNTNSASLTKERMAINSLAEKFAITKLSKDLKLDIRQNVKIQVGGPIFFDGIAFKGNELHAITIKTITNERTFHHPSYFHFLETSGKLSKQISAKGDKFILHLAAIILNPDADIVKIEETIKKYLQKWSYSIQLHVWRLSDLEKELISPETIKKTI